MRMFHFFVIGYSQLFTIVLRDLFFPWLMPGVVIPDASISPLSLRKDSDSLSVPADLRFCKKLVVVTFDTERGLMSTCIVPLSSIGGRSTVVVGPLRCALQCSSRHFEERIGETPDSLITLLTLGLHAPVPPINRKGLHLLLMAKGFSISPPTTARGHFCNSRSANLSGVCASHYKLHPKEWICGSLTEQLKGRICTVFAARVTRSLVCSCCWIHGFFGLHGSWKSG